MTTNLHDLMERIAAGVRTPWFWRDVVLPFGVSRAVLIVSALMAFYLLPRTILEHPWELARNGTLTATPGNYLTADAYPLINMWSRWDTGWYLGIMKNGYSFTPGGESNTAFFPLYPMLGRVVHRVIHRQSDASWLVAGMIVSNTASLVGLTYLVLLVRLDFDESVAARVALYTCVFPTTLFLSAVYSESVFLALSVAAFYYARKNRWLLVGLLGAAAALTRSAGFLLAVPLGVEYLHQRRYQLRAIRWNVLYLGLIPLALAAYMAFLYWRFGSPTVLSQSQAAWDRVFTPHWVTIAKFFQGPREIHVYGHSVTDFCFAVAAAALTVFAAVRLRPSYVVYAAISLFFMTAWGMLISVPRYLLVVFPLLIVLALLGRNRVFHETYVVISVALAAVFIMLFCQWQWVA
jgi:hypothetical protein